MTGTNWPIWGKTTWDFGKAQGFDFMGTHHCGVDYLADENAYLGTFDEYYQDDVPQKVATKIVQVSPEGEILWRLDSVGCVYRTHKIDESLFGKGHDPLRTEGGLVSIEAAQPTDAIAVPELFYADVRLIVSSLSQTASTLRFSGSLALLGQSMPGYQPMLYIYNDEHTFSYPLKLGSSLDLSRFIGEEAAKQMDVFSVCTVDNTYFDLRPLPNGEYHLLFTMENDEGIIGRELQNKLILSRATAPSEDLATLHSFTAARLEAETAAPFDSPSVLVDPYNTGRR